MLKKTISWTDFEDNPRTEDFYFHLSKGELAEMKLVWGDGMEDYIKQIIADQDGAAVIKLFKEIISKSYGIKSEDGKRFIKSPDLVNEFFQTGAYSELFLELVTSADAGASFINGVLPSDLADKVAKGQEVIELPSEGEPAEKSLNDYTQAELLEMPAGKFDNLLKAMKGSIPREILITAMQRKDANEDSPAS